MAYAALVQTACEVGLALHSPANGRWTAEGNSAALSLGLWTVELLLSALHPTKGERASLSMTETRRSRLSFMLVSLISCVPPLLLTRVLAEVKKVILSEKADGQKQALVDAVFREVLETVGDSGKQEALQWWYDDLTRALGPGVKWRDVEEEDLTGKDLTGTEGMQLARL